MTTENVTTKPTSTRATPIPQGYDRILAGALKLPLKERADISNALIAANKKDRDILAQQLKDADTTIGTNGQG